MTDLENYTKDVFCSYGNKNKEDFLKLLTALVYFDSSEESCIEVDCFVDEYSLYEDMDNTTLKILARSVCEHFQPRLSRLINNCIPRKWGGQRGVNFLVKLQDFYQYFPSARERIGAKLWIIETLAKYQLPSEILENLFLLSNNKRKITDENLAKRNIQKITVIIRTD